MYQSEYPASSINILSSDTLEPNVVQQISHNGRINTDIQCFLYSFHTHL